jgi:hypothetical protein
VLALGSYLSPRASTLEGTTATALWAALTDECLAMLVEQVGGTRTGVVFAWSFTPR